MNEEAKEYAEKAIEKANDYLSNGDFEKAERMAEKAQRICPSDEATKLLAKIQFRKQSSEDNKNNVKNTNYSFYFKGMLNINNLEESNRCIEVAQKAINSKDLEKAERMLNKAEKLYPSQRAKDLLKQIAEKTRKRHDNENQALAMKRVMNAGHDPYKILGVPNNCDAKQVRSAYRSLAKLLHPDKNKRPGAQEAFVLVVNAMEKLVKKNRGK